MRRYLRYSSKNQRLHSSKAQGKACVFPQGVCLRSSVEVNCDVTGSKRLQIERKALPVPHVVSSPHLSDQSGTNIDNATARATCTLCGWHIGNLPGSACSQTGLSDLLAVAVSPRRAVSSAVVRIMRLHVALSIFDDALQSPSYCPVSSTPDF